MNPNQVRLRKKDLHTAKEALIYYRTTYTKVCKKIYLTSNDNHSVSIAINLILMILLIEKFIDNKNVTFDRINYLLMKSYNVFRRLCKNKTIPDFTLRQIFDICSYCEVKFEDVKFFVNKKIGEEGNNGNIK